ncbi:hypothetical protein SDC9_206273 [bioreactor metagenome]|uniref:Uncharacterized protein n=1 Tax=bioreactor metagenome TaxID=1076179 RepID=A0A645J539_9ZZZZ
MQNLDFLRCADDRLTAERDRVALEIDRQAVVGNDARVALGLFGCAAKHRLDAGDHLAWAKRFYDIVVRAELQPDNAVNLLAFCGEHQNRQLRGFANLATDLDSAHLRHHNIQYAEHDLRRKALQRGSAVERVHRFKALRFEIYPQRLVYDLIIVRN